MSTALSDPFGKAFMAYYRGEKVSCTIRRDDGYLDEDNMEGYFQGYDEWLEVEKKALQRVRGRVLDVGCGVGRHALWLQERGFTVTGIDISPLALEVARLRGVRDCRLMDVKKLDFPPSSFETVIMMGNNFGLAGNVEATKKILREFHEITAEEGRIIAESRNPLETDNPRHLAYHERNRRMRRPPGQVTIRLEFKGEVGPWFDLLLATQEEMAEMAETSRWQVKQVYVDESGRWRGLYAAILTKNEKRLR